MTILRIVFAISLVSQLVAGCSIMRLGYKNLDFLLEYQTDEYFALSNEQEKKIEPKIAALVDWFKNKEALQIAENLRTFQQVCKDGQNLTDHVALFGKHGELLVIG